jgi:hypothetical protein
MSDISVRAGKTYLNENQKWIGPGGISALRDLRSITLNRALFDLVTAFPNGFIPSGIVLAKVTATGLYGPYLDSAEAGAPGRGVALGFLAVTVEASTPGGNISAALYWHGEVVEAQLPAGHGLDAAGRTDLAAKFALI